MAEKIEISNVADLYRRYQAGESSPQLATAIGASPQTVIRAFKAAGYAMRNAGKPSKRPSDKWLIEQYVGRQLSSTEIAALMASKPAPAQVRRWLRRLGVMRTLSESGELWLSRRTVAERLAQTAAAHAAVRGMKRTTEELEARAQTRERKQLHVYDAERLMARWLNEMGLAPTLARAEGPFNIDVAVSPIAVEVFGGGWHNSGRHAARHARRTRYLLDRGWHLVIVWADGHYPLMRAAAEYVVAVAKFARRNPTAPRQYRVIGGTGEEMIRGCSDDDQFPTRRPRKGPKNRVLRCAHEDASG